MFDVEVVSFVPLDKIIASLDKHTTVANSIEIMNAAVPALGTAWGNNYRLQGARVGGWKPLSPFTQSVREERGYNGSSPILRQTGSLIKNVVTPFQRWSLNQHNHSSMISGSQDAMRVTGANSDYTEGGRAGKSNRARKVREARPEHGGEPTFVNAATSPRMFKATINGPKALNQTGGAMRTAMTQRGYVNVPARPFWFFDTVMLDDAAKKIGERFTFRIFEGMPGKI